MGTWEELAAAKQAGVKQGGRFDPGVGNQEGNLVLWLVQLVQIQVLREPTSMGEYGFFGLEIFNKPEPHDGDDEIVRR